MSNDTFDVKLSVDQIRSLIYNELRYLGDNYYSPYINSTFVKNKLNEILVLNEKLIENESVVMKDAKSKIQDMLASVMDNNNMVWIDDPVGALAEVSLPKKDIQKPHKGRIRNWHKEACTHGGLNYYIIGEFLDSSPNGSTTWGHTSYVVKHDEDTGEIETKNSRYRLVA